MTFHGADLIRILKQQRAGELVHVHEESRERMLDPTAASHLAENGGFVGIGYHKRIRSLKARNLGLWHGRRTTERVRNDTGEYIGGLRTLKHVGERAGAGNPDPNWMTEAPPPVATCTKVAPYGPGPVKLLDSASPWFGQIKGDPPLRAEKLSDPRV